MKNYIEKIKNLPKRIDREIETVKYKKDRFADWLHIMNVEESLQYIETHSVSFYRYGDGEIALMMGEGIPFQRADEKLAERLREMLKPDLEGIKAAIPYYYFHYECGLIGFVESFAYAMKCQRRYLLEHCDKDYVIWYVSYLDQQPNRLPMICTKMDIRRGILVISSRIMMRTAKKLQGMQIP